MLKLPYRSALLTLFLVFFLSESLLAQTDRFSDDRYLTPPESISEEVLAPSHRNVSVGELHPQGTLFVNRVQSGLTPLAAFAKPHYNLAGLQIDGQANRQRSLTTQRATTGIELVNARTGERRALPIPDGLSISHINWSPDGTQLAWLGHEASETHLYVTNAESGNTRQVTRRPVLATMEPMVQWSGDGQFLFTVLVPENRGNKPVRPASPDRLQVTVTTPDENRLRTYPSLLKDRYEADLLEYYITGQLVRIEVRNRRAQNIGQPAMIRNADASPDGSYVMVQTVQKPFSQLVPVSRFAWDEEIWDLNGNRLVLLRQMQANEGIPDSDLIEDFGRRDIKWRPDGEGLSMLLKPEEDDDEEADDNGESNGNNSGNSSQNDIADRVIQWLPPFGDDDQTVLYESKQELRSVSYDRDGERLYLNERRRGTDRLFVYDPATPDSLYTITESKTDDFYDRPGSPSFTPGALGVSVVRTTDDGEHLILTGMEIFEEFNEQAPRPFVDRVHITSGETERLFQSSETHFESVSEILTNNANELIIERESAAEFPNYWFVDLTDGSRTQLTENVDYNAAVTQATRDRFLVRRADGIEFWMDVVMPADWDGDPLPGILWHYPREYDDQDEYNESLRFHNINRYPRVGARTADIFVKEGYAVLSPDWPIVGQRGTSNDNFVWSVVQNSTAVIDSAAARGYIDRSRMAIGGHSYGAFGTANAMIHTSLFKAGIAGAGNYNRTLTPFGFQRERSDLWRGLDRYMQMSPIFWADRLDGALLMYHGEMDQNVGTWPTNSRRMFQALNSMGKTAALYMYPYEGHGQAAEETLLDLWSRWIDWMDEYVK
ncbi:MAG: S9 family peptidase [Balneolaceae bacterium]